jgi:hypothetical protein
VGITFPIRTMRSSCPEPCELDLTDRRTMMLPATPRAETSSGGRGGTRRCWRGAATRGPRRCFKFATRGPAYRIRAISSLHVMTANYYGMISLIVSQRGAHPDCARDLGSRADTLVVYTTDSRRAFSVNHGCVS